ncbi:hypothetical protein EJD97_014363 [Solanum chilense]|uniref:Bet v I/Major latex protein domain-containing protein n=1 Tax=Solanum chilense TaxID=4083 RepID=A0A6N2BE09_SOLCI|nr:hypothetical protein EJD97_014363 [Solanum chilense]
MDIHEGELGNIGSIKSWKFTYGGKEIFCKVIYWSIINHFMPLCMLRQRVKNNLVTWIMEYEKKNVNVPDPHTLMELCINVTKDVETYNLK